MPDDPRREQEHRNLPARREEQPRELVMVRARADVFRHQLDESRERFRLALEALSQRTAELNPVTRMRAHPWRWVLGGFTVGLLFGLITTRD